MGYRGASQVLRHFKVLAQFVPNYFVGTIWATRLPPQVKAILASYTQGSLLSAPYHADKTCQVNTPADYSQHFAYGSPQHSQFTGTHRGALAPGRLTAGTTDIQPLAVHIHPPFAVHRPSPQHHRLSDNVKYYSIM